MKKTGIIDHFEGRIVDVDEIETQRMENDMRRRFERILGAKSDV